MASLSFNQKRLIVGIALAPVLLSLANYYLLDPGLLVPYKKQIVVASFVILWVAISFFGPTQQEMKDHRSRRDSE